MSITTILIIVNVFAAISMIALTLMQGSKGDMGSAFGGGGSQSMFGSRGSSNFLSKSTAVMCTVFFVSSIALAYTYAKRGENSIVEGSVIEQVSEVPSIDTPASEVPSIEVPSVDTTELENSVPTAESLEAQQEAVVEQLEELKADGDQTLEELRTKVEGAIEEAKEKASE